MRRNIGLTFAAIGGVLKLIFTIALFGGAAVGIWWPLTQIIIDGPVNLLWAIPLGFFATGIAFWLAGLVYNIVIGFPLAIVTTWLLEGKTVD